MKKIFLISLIFITLLLSSYFVYFLPKIENITNQLYIEKSLKIKYLFQEEVDKKYGKTTPLTYLISQDKKIIEALKKKDRNLLNYEEIIEKIEDYGEYTNLWLQVIDKNGFSFYRSWTKNTGDYLALIREDVADMIRFPRPIRGVSTGRFDMTFKTMIPLYSDGEFIGIVELISKFNTIAQILKDQNIESLMILDKKHTKNFIKSFSTLFIDKSYVANLNAPKELMSKVEKEGLNRFLRIKNFILFENYLVTTDQIKDIHGKEMGFFIFFFKENKLDKSKIANFKIDYYTKVIISIIIYILAFLYLLNRNYARRLNIEVIKKTSQIKKQKDKLTSLVKIYDKNVIFSKTDLNGIITHASKAFCKISGYSKAELIGNPHSIVRHPDMPKEVFETMWKELKKGNNFVGEVKNQKKDGSFYWVMAEIEPEYDKNGNHIGFLAVREDITANKEIEEIQKEIIFTMGSIGESKSKETAEHVKRVAQYTKILALAYGLKEDEAEMLKQASPMHDIGKVAIPDNILHKSEKLTQEEFAILKTHAQKGYEMLKMSNRPLLKAAATIALTHHEKFDGTGYPKGLKGNEIPLYGRITAIADVFDALAHDRCYKKAWEIEKVLEYFKNEKGKHFDPELIDLFFENFDVIIKIKNTYKN